MKKVLFLFAFFTSMLFAAAPGYSLPATSAPAATDISSVSFSTWFKADSLTVVADGTAVSTWADSSGNSHDATQATSNARPVYKVAANGLNGYPCVRFDGTNDSLATTAGAQAMLTSFYVGVVVRYTGVGANQSILDFGDTASNRRRSVLTRSDNRVELDTNGVEYNPGATNSVTSGTGYFVELAYDGQFFYFWLNGAFVSSGTYYGVIAKTSALTAFTGDAITLGQTTGGSYPLNGDLFEVMTLGSFPTDTQRRIIKNYVATKYGLTVQSQNTVVASNGSALVNTALGDTGTIVRSTAPLAIGGDQLHTYEEGTAATLSVNGPISAKANSGGEHTFTTFGLINAMAVQNTNPDGYSAIRFLDYTGRVGHNEEGCAFGWAPKGKTPFAPSGSYGGSYIEASNLADQVNAGYFSFVQTGQIGGNANGNYLRYRWLPNGDCVHYDLTGAVVRTWKADGSIQQVVNNFVMGNGNTTLNIRNDNIVLRGTSYANCGDLGWSITSGFRDGAAIRLSAAKTLQLSSDYGTTDCSLNLATLIIAETAAPSAPASGCILYVDSTTHNLCAKFSTGAAVVIGTHP